MSEDELQRLRDENARLRDELEAERRTAAQWRQVAEDRRVTLERLRQRQVVRWLFTVAKVVMPIARRLTHRIRAWERRLRSIGAGVLGARHRLTARARERDLRRAVDALPTPADDPRPVSVVVLTRDGHDHVRRLLPALRRTAHDDLEILVVDNGSGPATARFLEAQEDIRVVRNERNESFSEANNEAARSTRGEVLLFLNDDAEPLDEHWLARMLQELRDGVVAVGAQLVYPRRSLLAARTRDVGIQHLGIELTPEGDGVPRAVNIGDGADPVPHEPAMEVAAVTGACLLVDRGAFEDVGGFDPRYVYGAEDVDLCWRLRRNGGRVAVTPGAVLFHHEGATRHRELAAEGLAERQRRNWDLLAARFGPELRRATELDRIRSELRLCRQPYQVAITVTRDLESAGYGDWYTAHELGDAMERRLGWEVRYIERYRDAWYDLPEDVDAVIVLHDTFDVRRISRPGLTTIAWVRNWTDRWLSHPWFEDLDLVLASSGTSARLIQERSRSDPDVLPLATNPDRFSDTDEDRDGVVLTANHWGEPRGIEDLVRAVPELRLYGRGWEDVPEVGRAWQGSVPYADLPGLYARSLIVVDQTAEPTLRFGALNSRVFDALAAGALVVTDQRSGADELFGDELPTYEDPSDLAATLDRLLADPRGVRERAQRLRERVRAAHTYADRADRFRSLLERRADRPRFVVKTSAPDRREARTWGDTFFAEALIRELRAAGHPSIMQTMDEWEDRRGMAFDVSLHLKGRSRAPRFEGQTHVLWVISHPEELDPHEVELADAVFVASQRLADELRGRSDVPVHYLPQATDERRFRPHAPASERTHDVAFVGNSRFVERPVVRDALAAGLRPAIYGANWERFIDPDLVTERFVPNDELPLVYSSVRILLNDHWTGMREWGLVSNRIFDALACGTCVVSDHLDELAELFGDAVATYRTPDDLRATVQELLAHPERRAAMGQAGRRAVLEGHTFRHRVEAIVSALGE